MANVVEQNKTYQVHADALFEYCVSALELDTLNTELKRGDLHSGRLSGRIPKVKGSWFDIEIEIVPITSTESRISIKLYPLGAWYGNRAPLGGGKQAEEKMGVIFSAIDEIIRRAHIKYS